MPIENEAQELAKRLFDGPYRGYVLTGLYYCANGGFILNAFMPDSPLHPHDCVYVKADDEPIENITMWSAIRLAVLSLKRMIDNAYDAPEKVRILDFKQHPEENTE